MIYNYCGIMIESEFSFPFFECALQKPDIKIIGCTQFEHYDDNYPPVFIRNDHYIVNFKEQGYYKISKDEIVCCFKDINYMYATICNIPIAIVALLRGMLPLHCSSLVFNEEKAVLFLGEKGVGKTTLACVADNHVLGSVLGDDMVTVSLHNSLLCVHRGSKLMKVSKDTALLLDSHRILDEVYPGLNKNYYFPKSNVASDVVKFNKAFILSRGNDFICESIPNFLCKPYLMRHIVGIKVLESPLAHIINRIINNLNISEVYKLTIPNDLFSLRLCILDIINTTNNFNTSGGANE